jgi:hypothetical protein
MGLGLDHLRELMLNGLDGAWISDATCRQWKRDWTREFDRLQAQLREAPQPAEDHLSPASGSSRGRRPHYRHPLRHEEVFS